MSSDQGAPEAESASDLSPDDVAADILRIVWKTLDQLPIEVEIDAAIKIGTSMLESTTGYIIQAGRPDLAMTLLEQLQIGLDNLKEAARGQAETSRQDETAGA